MIDADKAAGGSQSDFLDGDVTDEVRREVPALNRAGFDVYQGGGNIFQVAYGSSGPVVVHIRPLAQRLVKPIFA